MHTAYTFAPPYEHEFIGRVERMNRTVQNILTCVLKISVIKNQNKYGHLLYQIYLLNLKLYLVEICHGNLHITCESHYNFSMSPLLPFGCRIMAHSPTNLQTKLSDKATLHYYRPSSVSQTGIMLYNPKTKQTIIRWSFYQLESTFMRKFLR